MTTGPGHSTLSVHGSAGAGAPLATPIARATAHHSDGRWEYSRFANPTVDSVAARVAALEGAQAAALVGSGTAAISCALTACSYPGATIVAARQLCEDGRRLLAGPMAQLGRRVVLVEIDDFAAWASALARPEAVVAYVETLSNPGLRIADIPALAAIAHVHGAVVVADATLSTPINQRPLDQGCDLVVHSAGKYLNGHGDLIAGAIAGTAELVAAAREASHWSGATLDPAAAALLERGLKTLAIRMHQHAASAAAVARALQDDARVAAVHHPSLGTHPDAELASVLRLGGSGIVSFSLHGGAAAVCQFAAALRLVGTAPTLGATESLVWAPCLDDLGRGAQEWETALVRLSVGLEDAEDVLADLTAALTGCATGALVGAT